MTTRTTAIGQGRQDVRSLIGMTAATVALLGSVLLWQGGAGDNTAGSATGAGAVIEGVAPMGGLAERYREGQRGAVTEAAPPVDASALTDGAGRYLTAPVAAAMGATTTGGMAELYGEQQAAPRTLAAPGERIGGLAELYREQDAARRGATP